MNPKAAAAPSTTPCESTDHLTAEEDIADDTAACTNEAGNDPSFIAHAIGVLVRARNMAWLARDTAITREGRCKARSAEGGNPSFATVLKVAGALGFKVPLMPVPHAAT